MNANIANNSEKNTEARKMTVDMFRAFMAVGLADNDLVKEISQANKISKLDAIEKIRKQNFLMCI